MGKDLAEAFPVARGVFGEVDAALGLNLSRLCFEGPADELTLTSNAQPALFAHGAAVWALTKDALHQHVRAAAGHSLGEFTAYHAADAVSLPGAAKLVRRRGELMYETGVERAMEIAKDAGAKRAIKLPVSGAFHSPLMEPAVIGLTDAIATSAFMDPLYPVYSNVTAEPSTTAVRAKDLLLRQLTSPVRWSAEIRNIAKTFPEALYVEMGPGSVLSGLMGRLVKGARTFSCGTAPEVETLLQTVVS